MVIDPYGEVLNEVKSFDDEITIATITKEKLQLAGGFRYRNARRPELYRDIIGLENTPELKPIWMQNVEAEKR
jgi:predicted amidohydrolase